MFKFVKHEELCIQSRNKFFPVIIAIIIEGIITGGHKNVFPFVAVVKTTERSTHVPLMQIYMYIFLKKV